jgi:hypothetical protein
LEEHTLNAEHREVEEVALNTELGGVRGIEILAATRLQASPCLQGVDRASILAFKHRFDRKTGSWP